MVTRQKCTHRWTTVDRLGPWLVGALLLIGYVALFVSRLDFLTWHDDEAVLVLTGQAVAEGRALYREIWYNYPPGFALYLGAFFRVFGDDLSVGRWAVFAWGLTALGGVAALGCHLRSRWAGVCAALLLATAPHFVALSSAVMTEVPAFAAATWGVWAALRYSVCDRRRHWLIASGAFCSVAICLKPTALPSALVPAIAVMMVEASGRARWKAGLALALAMALPMGLAVLTQHPRAFAAQFVGTYLESQNAFVADLRANGRAIAQYLIHDKYGLSHVSLVALGGFGAWSAWSRHRQGIALLTVWLAATLLQLLLHTPLYRHHLLALLPPLAALAGVGLATLLTELSSRSGWIVAPLCLLLGWTAIELRDSAWTSLATVTQAEADHLDLTQEAIAWVQEHTEPDAAILTDGHIIAIRGERRVPLESINLSRMRIKTGGLSDQRMIDVARRERPAAIIFWEKKLDSLDDFATWVSCHYTVAKTYDDRRRIYRPRAEAFLSPQIAGADADLGAITLKGYRTSPEVFPDQGPFEVTLYWQAHTKIEGHYAVFVHLLDAEGQRIAQHDGDPVDGACPTWIWQPGELFEDVHQIPTDNLRAHQGPYRLAVGWYDRVSGERLAGSPVLLALEQ